MVARARASVLALLLCAAARASFLDERDSFLDDVSARGDVCEHDFLDGVDDTARAVLGELESMLKATHRWALGADDAALFEASAGGRGSSVFGHTTPGGANSLLGEWTRRSGDGVFVDLGSGAGHTVLQGAVLFNQTRFRGVELSKARSKTAATVLAALDARHPELNLSERVELVSGDLLEARLDDAGAVWVSSLVLGEAMHDRLKNKLESELRPGAVRGSASEYRGGGGRRHQRRARCM
ncbi:hypothetical protein M885DRAFT_517286 [Pelagophyceae sp. CCMP2097]|nr:hypothetical protein M885DRAFT_517286 [Pelagophyceae sp. CCMP2097]